MSKFVYEVDRYSSKYVINKFEAEEQPNGQIKINMGKNRFAEYKRPDLCCFSKEDAVKKYLDLCEKELKYAVRAYRRAMVLAGKIGIEVKSKI